jgi:hypothetical protein
MRILPISLLVSAVGLVSACGDSHASSGTDAAQPNAAEPANAAAPDAAVVDGGAAPAAIGFDAAAPRPLEPPNVACTPGCTEGCAQGCFDLGACSGGAGLSVIANVYTLGVELAAASAEGTPTLFYRARGGATWWQAHVPVWSKSQAFVGSLFGLREATDYELRLRVGSSTHCAQAKTLPALPAQISVPSVYVDSHAKDAGDGSKAAPFRTLASALSAGRGARDIHVAAGVYREAVRITVGAEGEGYLRVLGEPGAILDGADASAEEGTLPFRSDGANVWSTPWTTDPRYVSRDGARLYHYLSLEDLRAGVGKGGAPIPEGYFVSDGRLYVHSAASPAASHFQIPVLNTAIQISAAQRVWIEGLEVRYYGEGDYGKGIDITEAAREVVVRRNHVHDIPNPVWVRKGSESVRIEDNQIAQSGVYDWPWDAVKATDHENSAVVLAGGRGAIVARNQIHDVFNGVYAGSFDDDHNPALAHDIDVYENRLTRLGDDGFEPEGAAVNARFWGNAVDTVHNGISMAPITLGPVWVIRNRFTNYDQSGFKFSNDSVGPVFIYHNSCFSDRPQQNGMNVSGVFSGVVFRNNLIRGTSYAIESTQMLTGNDLDYDALYTTRAAPRIKWDNVRYDDLAAFCKAAQQECHGVGDEPKLSAPADHRFAPAAGSPLIDRALRIYGINDAFSGMAPDIGYAELGAEELPAP